MPDKKPTTASGYSAGQVELVRSTCLYVATKLGDLMDDLVIIGGLAPSLLIDQNSLPEGVAGHVGTLDLDVGLKVALLDEGRYQDLTERLRRAGFEPDENDEGNVTRQRWKWDDGVKVTVDFLIPPSRPEDRGGRIRNIETDFAAIIAPGLHLAFEDRQKITLAGTTIAGEKATRDVWVCGPAAYVALKALAFDSRGENKDAYDLYYVVVNHQLGPSGIAHRLEQLNDSYVAQALEILSRDFTEIDAVGPQRVARFITGDVDEDIQADVVGFIAQLLTR